jgi:hypothetical protein
MLKFEVDLKNHNFVQRNGAAAFVTQIRLLKNDEASSVSGVATIIIRPTE